MTNTDFARIFSSTLIALCFSSTVHVSANAQKPITIKFNTVDPAGASKLGYFPVKLELTTIRPAGITKEPVYRAIPKYAYIHLGNGPNSTYFVSVDEPNDADWKIYVDVNHNGDLTDDGDGAWIKKSVGTGRTQYGVNPYSLKASWGTIKRETTTAEYPISLYRFSNTENIFMYRSAARSGKVTIGGKTHLAMLVENDADALYSKPLTDEGKPVIGSPVSRPVWLLIDWKDDGKLTGSSAIDIRSPFKLNDIAMEAKVNPDGSVLELRPTKRVIAEKPKAAERQSLLTPGTVAPDFTAEAFGGGETKLSNYRGKVVILDFWATWCGPCMKSMPHIEKVYQSIKGQDVVVLALCVLDDKKAYEEWVPANRSKFTFNFAFDPAGRADKNIASTLYKVSGIPTTYIIDKDGKVVEAIVGYDENDKRVEGVLKKLGINSTTQK